MPQYYRTKVLSCFVSSFATATPAQPKFQVEAHIWEMTHMSGIRDAYPSLAWTKSSQKKTVLDPYTRLTNSILDLIMYTKICFKDAISAPQDISLFSWPSHTHQPLSLYGAMLTFHCRLLMTYYLCAKKNGGNECVSNRRIFLQGINSTLEFCYSLFSVTWL